MKKWAGIMLFVLLVGVMVNQGWAQGSLTPTTSPIPSMKTLQQVEPRIPISVNAIIPLAE